MGRFDDSAIDVEPGVPLEVPHALLGKTDGRLDGINADGIGIGIVHIDIADFFLPIQEGGIAHHVDTVAVLEELVLIPRQWKTDPDEPVGEGKDGNPRLAGSVVSDATSQGQGLPAQTCPLFVVGGIGSFFGEVDQRIARHPSVVIALGIVDLAIVSTNCVDVCFKIGAGWFDLIAILVLLPRHGGDGKLANPNGNNSQHLIDVLAPTDRIAQVVASLRQCLESRPGLLPHPVGMELDAR